MKKAEREAFRLRVATYYQDAAGGDLKETWSFFRKAIVTQPYTESSKGTMSSKQQKIYQDHAVQES